ncbi:MAG: signal peptidase II [Candidatus Magasanikbacteria bacterium]|nr:signal peptidase II [Candidatus Magasanikbacteria bacterium]
MRNYKINHHRPLFLSAIAWLAMDFATKYYAAHADVNSIVFIQNFFYLTLHGNKGVAFGVFLGHVFQIIVSIIILALLVTFGFRHLLRQKRNSFLNQILLGIIIGGALGNLINRIYLGYVIDFIVLRPFPVFNLADIGITVGLLILFFINYGTENKKS